VRAQLGHVGAPDDHEAGPDETVGEPTVRGSEVAGIFGRLQTFVKRLAGDGTRRILHDDRHAAERGSAGFYTAGFGWLAS
jgi:hypothetical protein